MGKITTEELNQMVEKFVSPESTEDHVLLPIVRDIPTEQLAEFFGETRERLDGLAKEYALTRKDVPNWIGANHSLAPYELRRKVEILEAEWRMRHN